MSLFRYSAATSLLGYIASLDGSIPWIIEDPLVDFLALYAGLDFFFMGRKTYQIMQSFDADNPVSKAPKESFIAATRTMNPDHFPDVTDIQENVLNRIRRLKMNGGKDI
ncbi:hypothetical protein FANTH_6810 [Fusarium anthophilum]|uniref:Uncharacterized protein n=1 Tax=Fusarium anthophilum TaxID=48485 RepID=A0A8H5E465_9HYPO|nr:hypothetical protein FANTH_6810 [Fusarium anthophilum]